jgi:hypothetical protein
MNTVKSLAAAAVLLALGSAQADDLVTTSPDAQVRYAAHLCVLAGGEWVSPLLRPLTVPEYHDLHSPHPSAAIIAVEIEACQRQAASTRKTGSMIGLDGQEIGITPLEDLIHTLCNAYQRAAAAEQEWVNVVDHVSSCLKGMPHRGDAR